MPDAFTTVTDVPVTLDDATDGQPTRSRIPVALLGRYADKRYGRFEITREQVDNWRRVLATHFQGRVPVDEDHKTDKGISSEASGWITSLSDPDENGQVWAQVEWTPKGESAVREKRYLYVSPTFVDDLKDEHGKSLGPALLRAALTNKPFLQSMPAISLSAAPPEYAERLPDERIVDVLQRPRPGADSRRAMSLTAIAKLLELDENADEAKILSTIQDRLTPKGGEGAKTLEQQAEEAGYKLLSADELDELRADATKGKLALERMHEQRFEAAFAKALEKAAVATDDDTKTEWRELYDANPDVALKRLEALPSLANTQSRGAGGHDTTDAPAGVDEDRYLLNQRIEAYMAEHNVDYIQALEAVV